jgi:hypothetical protein
MNAICSLVKAAMLRALLKSFQLAVLCAGLNQAQVFAQDTSWLQRTAAYSMWISPNNVVSSKIEFGSNGSGDHQMVVTIVQRSGTTKVYRLTGSVTCTDPHFDMQGKISVGVSAQGGVVYLNFVSDADARNAEQFIKAYFHN